MRTDARYRFDNFGATTDSRMYMEKFTGWSYWTFTQVADGEWNLKVKFGDTEVFNYTHSGCFNNICGVLWHGTSYGFIVYTENNASCTIECTEVRGILKAEA